MGCLFLFGNGDKKKRRSGFSGSLPQSINLYVRLTWDSPECDTFIAGSSDHTFQGRKSCTLTLNWAPEVGYDVELHDPWATGSATRGDWRWQPPHPDTHTTTTTTPPWGGTRMCSGWWNVCYMLPWICWLIHLSPGLTVEKWIRGCEGASHRRKATLQTCWERTPDHFAHSRVTRQSGEDMSDSQRESCKSSRKWRVLFVCHFTPKWNLYFVANLDYHVPDIIKKKGLSISASVLLDLPWLENVVTA